MKFTIEKAKKMMNENGGSLDLRGTSITETQCHQLESGDYVKGRYLYADGILTHIKNRKSIKDYDFYIGKIKNRHVISDGVFFAHCKSFKDGVNALNFKKAKDRGQAQYKDLSLESVVSQSDAITMYRIITGACKEGTNHFLNSIDLKEEYTIAEIIEITKGQYNSDMFKNFFVNQEA